MTNIKEQILKLKDGECWAWPESDYGKAEIWFKHGIYFLFDIPTFGGYPLYSGSYSRDSLDELISAVDGWT